MDPQARAAGARLRARLGRGELDAPLGARTTYRVGGPAAVAVTCASMAELAELAELWREEADVLDVVVVGRGSNMLVADDGVAAVAVTLTGELESIEVDGTVVTAGGAVALPALARRTVTAGLTGLEWAVGVPGSVGGGVRMNAGGHGSDISATLTGIRRFDLLTGHDEHVPVADLALGYRRSAVAAHQVVATASFALATGDRDRGEAELAEIVAWRRRHQPGGPNAGSVFTNPAGDSAGRLIDAVGLKGLRVGTAVVSDKHANFIQADAGGRAGDVLALMAEVRRRVREATGIDLHPETRLVGFTTEELAALEAAAP